MVEEAAVPAGALSTGDVKQALRAKTLPGASASGLSRKVDMSSEGFCLVQPELPVFCAWEVAELLGCVLTLHCFINKNTWFWQFTWFKEPNKP